MYQTPTVWKVLYRSCEVRQGMRRHESGALMGVANRKAHHCSTMRLQSGPQKYVLRRRKNSFCVRLQYLRRGYTIHFISYLLSFTLEDFFNVSLVVTISFKLICGSSKDISASHLSIYKNECIHVPIDPFLSISAATIQFQYASVLVLLLPSLANSVYSLSTAERENTSICLSPASAFPKVLPNGPQDSAWSCLLFGQHHVRLPVPSSLHSLLRRAVFLLPFAWLTPHSLVSG